ncbi:hypothetical protein ENBRE01_0759 [Enteropsectra breve]|nr:hypothetical protein ENBRE01_0759 [Enteropsectra breve]
MLKPLKALNKISPLVVVYTSMFLGLSSASAVVNLPKKPKRMNSLSVNMKCGETEPFECECTDVLSSRMLMNHIEMRENINNGSNSMEVVYNENTAKNILSKMEKLYNGILNNSRWPEDDFNAFETKINEQMDHLIQTHPDGQCLESNANLTLSITKDIMGPLLRSLFLMRNKLTNEKGNLTIDELANIIALHAELDFKENLYSDIFFNLPNGVSKHFVILKDYLFAINIAIHLHHLGLFREYKPYFVLRSNHSRLVNNLLLKKTIISLEDNMAVKRLLSIIDIEVGAKNEITDIVIRQAKTTFGFAMRTNGTLSLKPYFSSGSNSLEKASVLSVFDKLYAFEKITHIRAICHNSMGEDLDHFYYSIICLFPNIFSMDLEDFCKDENRDDGTNLKNSRVFDSVLATMLKDDSIVHQRIKELSFINYNSFGRNFLDTLRKIPLTYLGLFGNFEVYDFFYAYYILKNDYAVKQNIKTFKGSPQCHKLVARIKSDMQLKNLIFYMGHQQKSIPSDFFAEKWRKIKYSALIKFFKNKNIADGVEFNQPPKVVDKIEIIYRYHSYIEFPNNSEKIFMHSYIPQNVGLSEKDIFSCFKAQTLELETEFYINTDQSMPSVNQIKFNTGGNKLISDDSLNAAFKVLDLDAGKLIFDRGIKIYSEETECNDVGCNYWYMLATANKILKEHNEGKYQIFLNMRTNRALRTKVQEALKKLYKPEILAINKDETRLIHSYKVLPRVYDSTIENILLD